MSDNPYQPPTARVDDRQPDGPGLLPRAAAALAFVFAAGMLAILLLQLAVTPAPARLLAHVDRLAVVLAASVVGLLLWRYNAWGWWIGLLGGGYVFIQAVLRVKGAGPLSPAPDLWFSGAVSLAFLAVLLMPRTVRGFTR
jgi:hypothetical protein